MEVVDPQTVTFTLTAAYPDFPHVLATDVGMITNPRVVAAKGPDGFANDPTGGGVGPYEFEKYAPGEEIVLKAKSDYWGGPVCIQELHFVRLNGAASDFRGADQQGTGPRLPARVAGHRRGPRGWILGPADADQLRVRRFHELWPATIPPRTSTCGWLWRRESILKRSTNGFTAVPGWPLPRSFTPTPLTSTTAQEGPKYDPEAAKAAIAKAKAAGWDGKVTLVAENSPTVVDAAIAVKAQLESLGMTVDNSRCR